MINKLYALCGLLLLTAVVTVCPVRAELLTPRDVVVKAISPTAAQTKKLAELQATIEKKTEKVFKDIEPRYIKRVMTLAETPKYKAQLEAAAALPEEDREAAVKKIWQALNDESRPGLEKELFTLMRGIAVDYFDSVGKFATAAQKPKLAKARTTLLANFDKELPAALHEMTTDFKVEGPAKS
jgi:hypothetical protein